MKKKYIYFLSTGFFLVSIIQLFTFSSYLRSEDELHQEHFNMKYGIFAIVQPDNLDFAGEEIQ